MPHLPFSQKPPGMVTPPPPWMEVGTPPGDCIHPLTIHPKEQVDSKALLLEEGEMGLNFLKPKVGTAGGWTPRCSPRDTPRVRDLLHNRTTLLSSTVVSYQLGLFSQVLHVLTFQEKEKPLWHNRELCSFSGKEKLLHPIVSKQGLFFSSEFSFLLLKQTNNKNSELFA